MSRSVTVSVTSEDIGAFPDEHEPHDAVTAAIRRALPGVTVTGMDPVDIELAVVDRHGGNHVRWTHPTPDPAALHLYHEHGPTSPYSFDLTVPDCLAAYLCHGPENA